jgi:hypothetical protein
VGSGEWRVINLVGIKNDNNILLVDLILFWQTSKSLPTLSNSPPVINNDDVYIWFLTRTSNKLL